jgi:hypothetical protein
MQADPREASLLELADRGLIDARQRLHRPLRQPGPTTPFVRFDSDPNQLIGNIGLERSHFSVHGIDSTGHRLPDSKLTIRRPFAEPSPALSPRPCQRCSPGRHATEV